MSTIREQTREISITNDAAKTIDDFEFTIMQTARHLTKRIMQDGDIDWDILKKEGKHHLFNIGVGFRRENWDMCITFDTDVEHKE